MITCKKKEAVATSQLNAYVEKELNKTALYMERDVHNKIDSIIVKKEAILHDLKEKDDWKEAR